MFVCVLAWVVLFFIVLVVFHCRRLFLLLLLFMFDHQSCLFVRMSCLFSGNFWVNFNKLTRKASKKGTFPWLTRGSRPWLTTGPPKDVRKCSKSGSRVNQGA